MNKNQIVGRAIALCTAIFCGFNTTLSRLACDTGTTTVSLTLFRFLMSAASENSSIMSLQAISRIGGAIFALLLNFEPVVILLLAWIIIGESLSPERISGMALILFALFLSQWKLSRTRPQSAGPP